MLLIHNNLILLDEEKPIVDEDIEVKRMKRLEQLKARRAYHDISEDGSGWVPLSNNDTSPPRKQRVQNDTPSPEPEVNPSTSNRTGADLSPSCRQLKRYDTPSPEQDSQHSGGGNSDLSPPRKHRDQSVTDVAREPRSSRSKFEDSDMSPPRRKHVSNSSPDISPPRRRSHQTSGSNGRKKYETSDLEDLSPPRRGRRDSPSQDTLHGQVSSDLSPPRRRQHSVARSSLSDVSHRSVKAVSHQSLDSDLSPPRKNPKELSIPASVNERKTGLISGKDMREEIDRKRKDDLLR